MLNLSDALTALTIGLVRTPSDDLNNYSDAIRVVSGLNKLVGDTMSMKDFFQLDKGTVHSFADNLANWSDGVSKSLIGLYTQSPSDTMSMSDGVALFRQEYLQIGDSLKNYLEKVQILLVFLKNVADNLDNWADATVVNRISNSTVSVADSLNSFTDSVSASLAEVSNCFA